MNYHELVEGDTYRSSFRGFSGVGGDEEERTLLLSFELE